MSWREIQGWIFSHAQETLWLANKNSVRTDVNASVTDEESRRLPKAGLKRKQGQTLHIERLKHWVAEGRKRTQTPFKYLILKVSCESSFLVCCFWCFAGYKEASSIRVYHQNENKQQTNKQAKKKKKPRYFAHAQMQTNLFRARSKSRTASVSQICRKGDLHVFAFCGWPASDCCLMFSHRPSTRMSAHVTDQTIHTFPDVSQNGNPTRGWIRLHCFIAWSESRCG